MFWIDTLDQQISELQPQFLFKGLVISHFKKKSMLDLEAYELSVCFKTLEQALSRVYPDLSYMELFALSQVFENLNLKVLFENYNFHWSETSAWIFECLNQAPQNFLKWCMQKKMTQNNLRAFHYLDFKNSEKIQEIFFKQASVFSEMNLTRQIGVQVLEHIITQLCLDENYEFNALPSEPAQKYMKRLLKTTAQVTEC